MASCPLGRMDAYKQAEAWKTKEASFGAGWRDNPLYSLNLTLLTHAEVTKAEILKVLTEEEHGNVMGVYRGFMGEKGLLYKHVRGLLCVPRIKLANWTGLVITAEDGSDATPQATKDFIKGLAEDLLRLQAEELAACKDEPGTTDYGSWPVTSFLMGAVLRPVLATKVRILPFGLNDHVIQRLHEVIAVPGTEVIVQEKTRSQLDANTTVGERYAADTRAAYDLDKALQESTTQQVYGEVSPDARCHKCNVATVTDSDPIVACDQCDKAYHVMCVYKTPMDPNELEKWYCPSCFVADTTIEVFDQGSFKTARVRAADLPARGKRNEVQMQDGVVSLVGRPGKCRRRVAGAYMLG